jgi:hypothetical protein
LSSDIASKGFKRRCERLGVDPTSYNRFETLHAAEVGSASAAAPTFFKPKKIEQLKQCYVDGGVWANSPVLPAIAEALGPLGISLDQIRVLSIGTRFDAPSWTGSPSMKAHRCLHLVQRFLRAP